VTNHDLGKATRAPEVHGVVESQRTERYQAVDNPAVWDAPPEPVRWRWVIPCALLACAIGLAVVKPTPIDWDAVARIARAFGLLAVGVGLWGLARAMRGER